MGPNLPYPEIPPEVALWSDEEQAKTVVTAYTRGAESYSSVILDKQALIDWINKEGVKDVE